MFFRRKNNAMGHVCCEAEEITPQLLACLVWPKCNPNAAPWQATSEEEQAVSTVTAGPLRPKVNERRPLATDSVAPIGGMKG